MATHIHLITAFSSLLTAAIHTILYERTLYPRASFLTARFHNYPVHQSRHPLVCQWISDAVAAISKVVAEGTARNVVLMIYDTQHRPLERFMFDVSRFPVVAPRERDLVIERANEDETSEKSDIDLEKAFDSLSVDLSESFRAIMARLSTVSNKLNPLPPDCSYTVAVELKDDADAPLGHPQPWIPSEPGLQLSGKSEEERKRGDDLGGAKIVPVRAVEAGEMILEVWVEEGKAKFEATNQQVHSETSSRQAKPGEA